MRENFRATAAAVESAGAAQPRMPPEPADPFELGLDLETLEAFPRLKELHEARDAWKKQVAEARAVQQQRRAAEEAARAAADVKMEDGAAPPAVARPPAAPAGGAATAARGGGDREGVAAGGEASGADGAGGAAPHGEKHGAGPASEAADAACELTVEMLDELVACLGDLKPADDTRLRGELAALLRQHSAKRAKIASRG